MGTGQGWNVSKANRAGVLTPYQWAALKCCYRLAKRERELVEKEEIITMTIQEIDDYTENNELIFQEGRFKLICDIDLWERISSLPWNSNINIILRVSFFFSFAFAVVVDPQHNLSN